MTKAQRIAWIKSVKGKALVWSDWDHGDYFIPDGTYDIQGKQFMGRYYYASGGGEIDAFSVWDGYRNLTNTGYWTLSDINFYNQLSNLK